jgi:hypothetical protein
MASPFTIRSLSGMSEPFLERDFKAYEKHRQDDPEYNALRLSVRRKLKAMVDGVVKEAKPLGTDLSAQAGLHHPYTFNAYRVREQRAYACRGTKERKKLASFFGDALGKDAETHYIQTVLEACIDDQVVEAALRIHPQAWWDGENLKKKCLADAARLEELCRLLRALPPGFNLKLHDWKKDHWCTSVKPAEVKEMFTHYTPGNHWLHVVRQLPKEDAVAMGPQAEAWVRGSLLALLPVYRFTLWDPS